jgi:hypothetical protein
VAKLEGNELDYGGSHATVDQDVNVEVAGLQQVDQAFEELFKNVRMRVQDSRAMVAWSFSEKKKTVKQRFF